MLYTDILCVHVVLLFLPFLAYPKPRTAFPEEREDDEDLSVEYDDSTCLSWKEILILTNDC
jgi:hypothetical protein